MCSILDRYISKTVIYNIVFVLLILLSLSSVIKFVDELRKINKGHYAFFEIGVYVSLSIIKDIELFFPMSILLGSLLGLGMFSIRNELVVMEACGFSRLQIVYSLIKAAFPVVLFGIFISEWAAPMAEYIAKNYRDRMINDTGIVFSFKIKDLWLKEENKFIFIEKAVTYNKLLGIYIYCFDQEQRLVTLYYASCAVFFEDMWILSNIHKFDLGDSTKIVIDKLSTEVWITSITPKYLSLINIFTCSTSYSIYDLYRYIQYLDNMGQNSSYYQLCFWEKAFAPISVIVMMLVALSCVFAFMSRKFNVNLQVVIGICLSFFFIF